MMLMTVISDYFVLFIEISCAYRTIVITYLSLTLSNRFYFKLSPIRTASSNFPQSLCNNTLPLCLPTSSGE